MIRSNYFVKKQFLLSEIFQVVPNGIIRSIWMKMVWQLRSQDQFIIQTVKILKSLQTLLRILTLITSDQIQDATLGVTSEVQPNRMSDNYLSQIMNKSCTVS